MPALETLPDGRFVSYAQNAEDAVLLRVFRDRQRGLWIDVGANHPVNDSVTKNFSQMGWTGINIEPVTSLFEALVQDRPNDVNIQAGVSDRSGSLRFYRNDSNLDLSTFNDELAAEYRRRGDEILEVEIPVTTLADICAEHVGDQAIDFLKIDAEGHELAVLRGHDFERFPPRVLLAEVGIDGTGIDAHLAEVGMRAVLFDGVNRWYVQDDEDDAFVDRLARPPLAVLDWYFPNVYLAAISQLDAAISERDATIGELTARLAALDEECGHLREHQVAGGRAALRYLAGRLRARVARRSR
jgi:FkbM family methyltransferase